MFRRKRRDQEDRKIFEKAREYVIPFATWRGFSYADAEDLAGDVALSLFKSPDSMYRIFDEGRDPKSYVLKVAASEIARKLRRDHSRSALESEFVQILAAHSSPPDDPGRVAVRLTLLEALKSLPFDRYAPIFLASYMGMSLSEIAEVLQTPTGTVSYRFYAGLAQLRKVLSDPGQDPGKVVQ